MDFFPLTQPWKTSAYIGCLKVQYQTLGFDNELRHGVESFLGIFPGMGSEHCSPRRILGGRDLGRFCLFSFTHTRIQAVGLCWRRCDSLCDTDTCTLLNPRRTLHPWAQAKGRATATVVSKAECERNFQLPLGSFLETRTVILILRVVVNHHSEAL